ncbi:MAG TPA: AsmA family protein, partial [Candidatus Omnitrophota bacterium]|nr:AsmA family protein [Candidatus Omnitrophota bacterium]
MKIVKIVFIVLLVIVLLGALGAFIFVKTFDLNRYKDQIVRQMSAQIGREVAVGHLDLSFSFTKGVALLVKDLSVKDSVEAPSGVWATVENIELKVLLKEYLSEKKIVFSSIRLVTPTVGIDLGQVLSADGEKPSSDGPADGPASVSQGAGAEKTEDKEPFDLSTFQLLIQSFEIVDGRIQVKSDGEILARDVLIDHFDFKIANFSIQEPFDFSLRCAALGSRNALDVNGHVRLDLQQMQARLDDVVLKSNISDLSWDDIRATFPQASASGVTAIGGELAVTVNQMIVSGQGVPILTVMADLINGSVAMASLKKEITNIELHSEYSNNNLEIFRSSLNIGQGRVDIAGKVNDLLASQKFDFDLNFKDIQLADLVPDVHPQIHPVALLNGKTKIQGSGFDPEQMLKTLQGQLQFDITEAKLPGFNLLKFVLGQISPIPGLDTMVRSSLPEKYTSQFDREETIFQNIALESKVSDGALSIPQLRIGSELFELLSSVKVGFDQSLVFEGNVMIPKELSAELVADIPQLDSLKNEAGAISIPLQRYQGAAQKFMPMPDLVKIGQKFLVEQGKKELNKILGSVLKAPEERASETTSSQGQEPSVPPQETGTGT